MKRMLFVAALFAAAGYAAEPARPSFDEMKSQIRKDHPRLYLTRETLPQFRQHANSPGMKALLDACRAAATRAPETPRIRANDLFEQGMIDSIPSVRVDPVE